MTVHVLDTGAIFILLNKHRPRLRRALEEAYDRDSEAFPEMIRTPAPVLIEVGQASEPPKRKLEDILYLAPVSSLDKRIAQIAADALRETERAKCGECSGFVRPTLVDAVVMAMASDWAEGGMGDAIVYTQDVDDMSALQPRFPKVQIQRV